MVGAWKVAYWDKLQEGGARATLVTEAAQNPDEMAGCRSIDASSRSGLVGSRGRGQGGRRPRAAGSARGSKVDKDASWRVAAVAAAAAAVTSATMRDDGQVG